MSTEAIDNPELDSKQDGPQSLELPKITEAQLHEKLDQLRDGEVMEASVIVTVIEQLKQQLPEEFDATAQELRTVRKAGSGSRHGTDLSFELDTAVLHLIRAGDLEAARALLSSSSKENENFNHAIRFLDIDSSEEAQTRQTLSELQTEKQSALRESLLQTGLSEERVSWIINFVPDPDAAKDIPAESWKIIEDIPNMDSLLQRGDTLQKTTQALLAIHKEGLDDYNQKIFDRVLELSNDQAQADYLKSFSAAREMLSNSTFAANNAKILETLLDYADPLGALASAEEILGDDAADNFTTFDRLLRDRYMSQGLTEITPQKTIGIKAVYEYFTQHNIALGYAESLARIVRESKSPDVTAAEAIEALNIVDYPSHTDSVILTNILNSPNPIAYAEATKLMLGELDSIGNSDFSRYMHEKLAQESQEGDPRIFARATLTTLDVARRRGVDLSKMGSKDISDLVNLPSTEAIDTYLSNRIIMEQFNAAYDDYQDPVRKTGSVEHRDDNKEPGLASSAELQQEFIKLGIPIAVAEQMTSSWTSYSELRRVMHKRTEKGDFSRPDTETIDGTITPQVQRIVKQLDAVRKYIEQYSKDEVLELTSTFGILNYIRYKPEELHAQLLAWKSGMPAAKNILVSATADWNGAIDSPGGFRQQLGADGFFFFEASDQTEVARAAVAVGSRERHNNRVPETTNSVQNFIIHGHARANAIRLGKGDAILESIDYANASKVSRVNDYRRHLGNTYRVVLQACASAGNAGHEKNIAQSIADHHQVTTEGSPVMTSGTTTISPDNTEPVIYNPGAENEATAIRYEPES